MKFVLHMYPVLIPLFVMTLVQLIKVAVDFWKTKKLNFFKQLVAAGGFPSVHSAISTSVTTLVWIEYGVNSMLFAVSCMFTLLFIYDAMNVRYEAGKHAHYINTLRTEIELTLQKEDSNPHLKERLGHTPGEVIGGIVFGVGLTLLLSKLIGIW